MKILLVDDDVELLESLTMILQDLGFEVHSTSVPDKAVQLFESNKYKLLILDISLPTMDGFELAYKLREKNADTPVLGMTGLNDMGDFYLKQSDGKHREPLQILISKPFSDSDLLRLIELLVPEAKHIA